ncbi:hypothetical protein ACVQK1_11985 [Edwardsiella tarda]
MKNTMKSALVGAAIFLATGNTYAATTATSHVTIVGTTQMAIDAQATKSLPVSFPAGTPLGGFTVTNISSAAVKAVVSVAANNRCLGGVACYKNGSGKSWFTATESGEGWAWSKPQDGWVSSATIAPGGKLPLNLVSQYNNANLEVGDHTMVATVNVTVQ